MPGLVDTTIRLLSQEPLAGSVTSARLLELAETLDRAGFETLEVSGGGCFEELVQRGVESPWERIRALKARCDTPLGIALRGRFLVGSRPVAGDLVRRFVASAAESGVDVFRIHDPLNDPANLREAAEAVNSAGKELVVGLLHDPIRVGDLDDLLWRAGELAELGASKVVIDDPAGSLAASHVREAVERVREVSGLPVGLHSQGAAGRALAASIEAGRGGASPIGAALYPVAVALYRPSAEALTETFASLGMETGIDVEALWHAGSLVADALDEAATLSLSPGLASRAARRGVPIAVVVGLASALDAQHLSDRLDEVLDELIAVREAVGWPPLVAPIGQILASQALLHVLSAQRWCAAVDDLPALLQGRHGRVPGEVLPEAMRAIELRGEVTQPDQPSGLDELRDQAGEIASSEEELLLLALFGDDAERLLRNVRARTTDESAIGVGSDPSDTTARIRELVEIVEQSGIGEVTIEEGDLRVTVRRGDAEEGSWPRPPELPVPAGESDQTAPALEPSPALAAMWVQSPMVGTFFRSPEPGASPFVDVGDTVAPGQTLCILEAMKLMNEIKAEHEAIVRRICVENEEPVEYGQVLFELEALDGRPLDAV